MFSVCACVLSTHPGEALRATLLSRFLMRPEMYSRWGHHAGRNTVALRATVPGSCAILWDGQSIKLPSLSVHEQQIVIADDNEVEEDVPPPPEGLPPPDGLSDDDDDDDEDDGSQGEHRPHCRHAGLECFLACSLVQVAYVRGELARTMLCFSHTSNITRVVSGGSQLLISTQSEAYRGCI